MLARAAPASRVVVVGTPGNASHHPGPASRPGRIITTCAMKAVSPHCPGSRPKRSPEEPGWPSMPDSPTTTNRRPVNSATSRNCEPPTGSVLPMFFDAWIDVDDAGRITGSGYGGGGLMGSTTIRLGGLRYRFQAVQLPDLQRDPETGDGWVRFAQTTGGRTGLPAPRRVTRKPFVQWQAPLVWTTLSLTLHADGRADFAMTGASAVPPALGLRRPGPAVAQVRPHRLPRLVHASPSASTAPGATRTRRRWSPRSRRRWSARCPCS